MDASSTEIIVAIIGAVGALGPAIISKISLGSKPPHPDSLPTKIDKATLAYSIVAFIIVIAMRLTLDNTPIDDEMGIIFLMVIVFASILLSIALIVTVIRQGFRNSYNITSLILCLLVFFLTITSGWMKG